MYKKIKNFLVIFLWIGLSGLSSCSKSFLEKEPTTSLGENVALTDVAALQTALNGAYARLRSTNLFGRNLIVSADLAAGNTFIEINNSGRYLAQFNYSITDADGVFGGIWNSAYAGIRDVNRIIDADISAAEEIKAQAYAIRALLYFKLINIYARPYADDPSGLGVPLILHYDPALLPPRETISNVYNQIISDLTTAFANAPEYNSSITLSKYAIEGLLAKVYLYAGDVNNAKTHAVDVIDNSGFSLVNTASEYSSFWHNPAAQSDKSEVLFEVDVTTVNNNGSDDLGAIFEGGYSDIYASQQLVNLYSSTDIRTSVLKSGNTKSGATASIVDKYANYTNASDKDNLKVIRFAEMYLIAAEASLSDNITDAQKYLNLLLSFRDPSFSGYTSTGSQLLSDIVNERRKELAFEGDLLYDFNRLKLDINRGTTNAGSINPLLSTIPYSDYRRIAPIPLTEIQANANIAGQQNPNY